MFPQSNTEFSKGNYLITSNDSLNRKEDRILNREYGDPYRYEKKMNHIYENDASNKFNLNTNPGDSFKNFEKDSGNIFKTNKDSNCTNTISNLNFNYDEYNKYKRKENVNSSSQNQSNNSNNISNKTNYRYRKNENISDELSSNLSLVNSQNKEDLNDYKNYNNELTYYREMIENMHNEIGNLNTKLNDLEKNNNVNNSKVYSNSNTHHTGSNLSTANFRTNRVDVLEKNIESLKEQFDMNMKIKEEKLLKLQQERDYLYHKNYEIEKNINTNSKFNTLNFNYDLPDKNTNENFIPHEKPKKEKNSDLTSPKERQNKYTRSNSVEKTGNKIEKNNEKASSKTKNNTTAHTSKSISRKRENIHKKSVEKNLKNKSQNKNGKDKFTSIETQNENNFATLTKENEILKNKILNLEKTVKNLTQQISLDTLEKKGKDHLRVELEIWKNRSEDIAKNYLETTANLKKQLLHDKTSFIDQIKSLQTGFTSQVNNLKNKYHSTIEKNEITIKKLRKENEELKKKVSKVKEILIPSNI